MKIEVYYGINNATNEQSSTAALRQYERGDDRDALTCSYRSDLRVQIIEHWDWLVDNAGTGEMFVYELLPASHAD